jgi:hypothetical protein
MHKNEIWPLAGLVSAENFQLTWYARMLRCAAFRTAPFRRVRSEFADQFTRGRVSAELFELCLIILHDRPGGLFRRTQAGGTQPVAHMQRRVSLPGPSEKQFPRQATKRFSFSSFPEFFGLFR